MPRPSLWTLWAILAFATAQIVSASDDEPEIHDHDHTRDAVVALASLTALVVVSIAFEMFAELLRESTDELNMPFVHAVFRELTTLGFIGLLLFVVTKLEVLPRLSRAYLGEREALQETIETLHMGLFFFVVIFLALCCGLLRLGTRTQREWHEFETGASDIQAAVADFVVATEPPRTWRQWFSLARIQRASKARREMVYLSLRQRFVDYRSNHPDRETARRMAKDFQLDAQIAFPFNEYLSIISGEVMARLIEIDWFTWVVLEICLVVVVAVCWQLSDVGEIVVLLGTGFLLVAMNDFVHRRILCMRELLTPKQLLDEAERLRRDSAWRADHHLPLHPVDEASAILEAATSSNEGFAPPYAAMVPTSGCTLSELALARRQRQLLGGGKGNGVRLALLSTRLVFLLTAMHLATFLMRTSSQVFALSTHWLVQLALVGLFLQPSVLVPWLSVRIARDGLYAFSVEHLKVHRVISRVMRIQRARRTLRTLRFVAEMKVYLREAAQRQSLKPPSALSCQAITLAKSKSLGEPRHSARGVRRANTEPSPQAPTPLDSTAQSRVKKNWNDKLRREIYWIFCRFDVDGSGCISRDEMVDLLLALTHDLDVHQLGRLMDDLVGDDETCSEITFEDFYAWCRANIQQCSLANEALVHEIFRLLDVDHSGFITLDEFLVVFRSLGHALDHDDVRELVCHMDRNADGKIDLEDFSKILRQHQV